MTARIGPTPVGSHAVVIGASMAGLLAGRVLSHRFERVTILDRDTLPDVADPRKGVPQGRHLHVLLARGRQILDELFPGLGDELIADGAVVCSSSDGGNWHFPGGCGVRFPSNMLDLSMTRPFLELHVRSRVEALANVTVVDGGSVTELLTSSVDGRTRVAGVATAPAAGGATKTILADLVVDAGGRGSRAPSWLEGLGYGRPAEEKITIGVGYTTRLYRRGEDDLDGDMFIGIQPTPPQETRAGVVFAVEESRWILTLGGWLGDHAPADDEGFLAFAKSLPAPDIYDLITGVEPLGDVMTYKFPANLRRRYEKMRRHPEGFVVIGDALCSFNPIYAQGMTVSALEAVALDSCLDGGLDGLPARFYRRAAKVVGAAWQVAAGADFAYPEVPGRRPPGTDLVNKYVLWAQQAATTDRRVHRALIEVTGMVRPPAALFAPRIIWGVLRSRRQRARAGGQGTARTAGRLAGSAR